MERKRKTAGLTELAKSIERIGVVKPISLHRNGIVDDGMDRLLAAKMAGLTEVPVVVIQKGE